MTTTLVGSQVHVGRLLAARAAIRLEQAGLKHSQGSVKTRWAKHYGLHPRTKAETVLERINNELKEHGL